MDLSSESMYDIFKEEMWRELGPLDPDWFDVLTAQAVTTEGNVSDQDDLCANQEGNFKTPFAAVESQLFSTPKVFRHSRVVSPETEYEQYFTAEPEKETLPWTTASPCLFQFSKEGVPGSKYKGIQPQTEDSFDLFHTPQKSPVNYEKHISESLGANIHPDISWTSSLNTPPAVPSTLILSKTDESPCPVSLSEDKSVIFVRKLFPSLSNASRVGAVSPKNNDPMIQEGADSPEAGQNPESHNSPSQSSLNQSDVVWRQKLPDAIKDGELRSTVASVLNGAENVLSIFFSNSSSALRKVKIDRIKRKPIISAKEHGCSSTQVATKNMTASSEQRTDDQQPCTIPSSPHLKSPAKTGDMGTTQWSPLSLSQIPPSTVDTTYHNNNPVAQVENNCLTEQQQIDSHSSQLVRPSLKISDSGFIKKKRQFVYTVETSKPQVQEKETHSQKIDSSPVQELNIEHLPNAQDEADCCNIGNKTCDGKNEMQEQEYVTENLPPSVQAKVQDADMSQLCRAFAQDFSQMSDPVKLSENPQNGFCPSACLSAMKQAKHKLREASLHHDYDGIRNRRHVSATNQNNSNNEGTISDSGFQSAVADITPMTAFSALPPSEKDGQTQQWATPFQATNKENRKAHLEDILHEAETDAKLSFVVKENQTLDPGRASGVSTHPSSSAEGAVDTVNCIPLNGQVHDSLPENTIVSLPSVHASGFRTASSKGIKISSANLERARHLFEETEGEKLSDQPTKCGRDTKDDINMRHRSVETTTSDSNHPPASSEKFRDINCQLTASQKADVTELCNLLEEADSQFEFTQLKTVTLNQQCPDNATSPQKADKELDPDFLTGIDFDDSFNSDAEKHVAVTMMPDIIAQVSDCKTNPETSDVTSKPTGMSFSGGMEKEKFSTGNVPSSSKHIAEVSSGTMSSENLDRAEHNEISNKKPLTLGVGFKTARGNVLRVSKKCLSKARALFADLEENLVTDKNSPDKQNGEKDAKTEQKDSVDNNTDNCVHHEDDTGRHTEFKNVNSKPSMHHSEVLQHDMEIHNFGVKNTLALSKSASFHGNQSSTVKSFSSPLCTTSKSIGCSAIDDLSDGGFSTASGKRLSVSSNAMTKAHFLLNEIQTHEDTEQQMEQKENSSRTGHLINQANGFQTAGGKGVAISSAALKKAKSLLRECVEDEVCVNPKHSKIPVHDPPSRNSGFLAASGKAVAFSSEALKKAKALFDDISDSSEIPSVSDTRKSDKKHEGAQNEKEKIHCGFSTAGGAKVCVSRKNLLKAKNLLEEFDDEFISVKAIQEADAFFQQQKKFMSSAVDELSNVGGFCTASWNKVSVSDDARTKAKSLLNESATFEDTNKQLIQKQDTKQNGGFQTASGKGVAISSAALKKAKSLLSECDDVVDKTSAKPTHSKMPFPGPPSRNSGFLAASGKPVAFSSEALQKAKALFDDISVSSEIPSVSGTRKSDKKQENAQNKEKIHYGFSTAGGAKVCVSQQNLLKAKNLLKEFDDESILVKSMQEADAFFQDVKESNDGMSVKHQQSSESVNKKSILPKFKTVRGVKVNISDEPVNGCTEFENVKAGPHVHHEKMLHHNDVEIHQGVLKSPLALTNASFLHADPSLMAKPHSSTLCTAPKKLSSSAVDELSNVGGFCTASWNKVSVSDDAMTKAKSLLNESATFEDTNKQLKQKQDTQQNGGFRTASGKGVAISSAALKKAKSLLSECDDVADKTSAKPTQMPFPGPPSRNSGFLAASGKPVAFSSEALQKAKALFDDISLNTDIPAVPDTWKSEKKHEGARSNKEKIHCGFTTAGGAKVQVSQKNLLKAKNLLREFDDDDSVSVKDGECPDSSFSTRPIDLSRDVKRTSNSNLATIIDKDIPAEESVPQVVKSHLSSQEADSENKILQNSSVHDRNLIKEEALTDAFRVKFAPSGIHNLHGEKRPNMLDYERHQTRQTAETSVLSVQSLNLSGCTETQQKFLAQEALDCTKALLEDEGLAGQSLSMTFENMPPQDKLTSSSRSVEEQKTAKRLAEDADMTAQPPLKRRLLDEFDRTLDPRGSTLQPEKSCPTGVMKDRRVFKYSVSLQPNITRPHRDGKNYMETRLQNATQYSAPGDSRSTHFKIPAFVPTFFKNSKTETHKNNMVKDNGRTPPAFVPPFKRQRTIVQESCSKPHEEEDKRQHISVMPSNSSTYVPPTKKTSRQSSRDVTGNKSREDVQMLALADNTKDDLVKDHKIPVGCGTEGSATEASGVGNMLSRSQEIQTLQNIELARDMQDMRIRKKKRQTIRPLPGSMFLTKTSGVSKIPLKDAVNGKPPANYTQKQLYGYGVHQHVSGITSETVQSFRFSLQQFLKEEVFIDDGGVQLADGGWLIPSKNGTAGKEEFYRALCDTPGVDPKLISEEWVYNHYRWIVWKQASMERSFPGIMGGLCLTPEQVLLQLKYRYDVEVDHSRRPALRKIMEQDDTAAKTLVLCACGVVSRGHSPTRQSHNDAKTPQGADAKAENPGAVVWLTDGWYAIKAQLDDPLTAMLHKGRLAVGGKLIINGAQLVGSQDACSPLEAPESLMLKICANSSRPARWDTKLGFYRDPRPFLLPLSCLYSNGGHVGCVDMVILRSYPIQWMERKPEGGVVFRSVRAEEKEARRYNSHKQKAMEIVLAKIQAEFETEEKGNNKPQRRRRTISRQDIASLQDGEELYEAVGDDPAYLEAHLSDQQLETLHTYRRSLMEKKQAELQDQYRRALENAEENEGSCPKRDVTPVWRLCIADSMNQSSSVYQLNMWRPSSDLQSLLKEGCRYKVYNLTTSDGKKRSGVETIQLTGTKKTQFQDLQASQECLSACFQPRVSATFVDLQNPDFQPLCGEVDLTGYVITIIDSQGSSPAFYVVDGKLNFIKVRCFSSLAQSGLEDVLKPRVLLALSNLQLRGQSISPTPVVYAGDLTVFSTNPKETHLQESLGQLRNLVQGQENFFLTAEEKLSYLVKSVGMSSIPSPALQPPAVLQQTTTDRRQDTKTSVTSKQPIRSLGSFTPVSRIPPPGNCSTEKDPKSLKRRRALDYLSRIPSPPPVFSLSSVASPCVNKTFNPPRRSVTPSTLKTVQTPAPKPVIVPVEDEWVNDEELAMIDTQALHVGDLL